MGDRDQDVAPRLPGGLPARLEGMHLRRRRRTRIVLAAAAVVLVAGGTVAVVGGGDTVTARQEDAASRTFTVKPSRPVEEVWPDAVRTIPAKDADGAERRVVTFVDDRTLLMATQRGSGRTTAVYTYDLGSGAQRRIAALRDADGFARGLAAGGGHVVWWTASKDRVARLWTVPLDGGRPRSVAEQSVKEGDGSGIDALAVAGDRIVFSLYAGGVFTVPLTGGTVEPVTTGAGMHLLSRPWAGTTGTGGEPSRDTRFGQIRNVETGETRTAVVHPGEQLRICGLSICLGTRDGTSFFRDRDGSARKDVAAQVFLLNPPVQNRFYAAVYTDGKTMGAGLYDLDRGTSGDLGVRMRQGAITMPAPDTTGRLLSYTIGDDLYLIDLAAIR